MNTIDDLTLMAYADGELDPESAREVERLLTGTPGASQRIALYRRDGALLRSAFNHASYAAPVDASTVPLVAADGPRLAVVGATSGSGRRSRWTLAVAAGICGLAVGVGSALVTRNLGGLPALDEATRVSTTDSRLADAFLTEVLESRISGQEFSANDLRQGGGRAIKAVRTFRGEDRQFCREYSVRTTQTDTRVTERGIACRQSDGTWLVRLRAYLD